MLAPSFVIVDIDAGIPLAEIEAACLGLTRQVLEHWAPAWGSTATVRATSSGPAQPGEWQLQLRRVPTIEGALGYHDRAEDGSPILYVFPELCASDGTTWTSCASHEILEALGDPLLRRLVQAPDGSVWALEVCDACESETYEIGGVSVSDFCFPAWFEPHEGSVEQYDYLGRCSAAFAITAGGYGQTWTPAAGWTQRGTMRAYRRAVAELGLGRGTKRAEANGVAT